MGARYFCEYCGVFLRHGSSSVRKQHMAGNRHRMKVADYYRKVLDEQLQGRVDRVVEEFERDVAQGRASRTHGVTVVQQLRLESGDLSTGN
ncbi:U1 small nuclear ribonucleoprotein C [Porphyridium purpureum]|uniref:U1 small nuclear ribonucleoprotein C n=1 Tax=Porphyridium purpureum TaxID=35688 RepID=A0A5J4YZL9_PORPP|nr:U1 small nuclear ribonucleoprotein C [Porphyridium purpureum]|eukprot:POR0945..scf208_2